MNVNIKFRDYSYALIEAENSTLMELRNYFSFEVEGARFNPKFRYGAWDGRIRLLSNEGTLPIGLVDTLVRYCQNNDLTVTIDEDFKKSNEISREDFDKWLDNLEIYSGDQRIKPHWYQADSVFTAINSQRRTLNLPTSAGKSLISALINRWYMENYDGKILVIVPTTALVQQMIDDYADYRIIPRAACLGIMSGTRKNSDALIYVSTWQSACKMDSAWFSQFGLVNVDECHLATGKEINNIVTRLGHCRFKFGMSGSLKDGNTNIMQYIGMFGDIFRPVSTKMLMDEGQVTELEINSVFLRYPDDETIMYKGIAYPEEIKVITKHTKRNAWVCKLALKLARDKNENVLVMFKNVKHGKMLYEALVAKYGDKVHYVSGETKTDDRVKLKGDAENEDGIIIVASYGVFSTGISIKKLHHIIFAHPVRSKVIVLQSLGRVLRKHQSKLKAKLWDIIDDFCVKPKSANAKKRYTHQNYAFKHGLERIARYNAEQFTYKTAEVIL